MNSFYSLDITVLQSLVGSQQSPTVFVCFGILAAKALIYLIPIHLIILWFYGSVEERRAVITIVEAIIIGLILAFIIGKFYDRPRPFAANIVTALIHHRANPSFPSDHAIIFFAYVTCLYLFRYGNVANVALVLACLTCWGRVFVGVHYPSDVFAGAIIGFVVARLVFRYMPRFPNFLVMIPPIRGYKKDE